MKAITLLVILSIITSCGKKESILTNDQSIADEGTQGLEPSPSDGDSSDLIAGKANITIRTKQSNALPVDTNKEHGFMFSGTWEESSLQGDKDTMSHYSSDPMAEATYLTDKVGNMPYCLWAYRMTHPNSTTTAKFSIFDDTDKLGDVVIDQKLAAEAKGWHPLGIYTFSTMKAKVVLSYGNSTNGFLRADDFRFKRVKEGNDCFGKIYRTVKKSAVIDNKLNKKGKLKSTAGYREVGTWEESVHKGFKDSISRYSYEDDAKATYTFKMKEDATLCLRLFRVTDPNSSKNVSIDMIINESLSNTFTLDYSLNTSEKGFVSLSQQSFSKDDVIQFVVRKAQADGKVLRADAVQMTQKLSLCQ